MRIQAQVNETRREILANRQQKQRLALASGEVPLTLARGVRLTFRPTDLIRPIDLAKLAGISKVAVCLRYREGKLPPYDIDRGKGRRFWWGATLNEWESPLRRRWLVIRG